MRTMNNYWNIVLSWCLLLILIQGLGFSQQTDDLLTQEILKALHAKNASKVERQVPKNQKEYLINVARAYRAYELRVPNYESGLFSVLPQSSEQIDWLYALTILNPQNGHGELMDLYENFYETVFSLAPKHPKIIPHLFAVAANYGGDLNVSESAWFCEMLHDLFEAVPRQYLHALAEEKRFWRLGLNCAAARDETE
jgi:hypothetical protein